jgi:4-hydroxymandelate oxidase
VTLDFADTRLRNRRAFLKFVAASPYVAALGGFAAWAQQNADVLAESVIGDPREARSVMDFEEAAHRKVQAGHWAYMRSGVDDDATLRANREGYSKVQLRPRRLMDATKVDTRIDLFGTLYNSPIFLCPTGGEKSFSTGGEVDVARAAKATNTMQMLSTSTSTAVEDVNKALGRPVWYQLYAPNSWDACEKIVRRVEAAGCPVIALTVDNTTGRNSETYLRTRPRDLGVCASCHQGEPGTALNEKPMYDGINMAGILRQNPAMTWDFVARLRKATQLKLFIKGIDTREDARMALECGVDGGWHPGVESRRTVYRNPAPHDSGAAGGRRRSRQPNSGVCRWRRSPRNRCVQSTGAWSRSGWHRPPHAVGPGSVRSSRRRTGARNPARRTEADNGELRNANGSLDHPRKSRDAKLAYLTRSLVTTQAGR